MVALSLVANQPNLALAIKSIANLNRLAFGRFLADRLCIMPSLYSLRIGGMFQVEVILSQRLRHYVLGKFRSVGRRFDWPQRVNSWSGVPTQPGPDRREHDPNCKLVPAASTPGVRDHPTPSIGPKIDAKRLQLLPQTLVLIQSGVSTLAHFRNRRSLPSSGR